MSIHIRNPGYQAYLLRLWREEGSSLQPAVWRLSLEDTQSGERLGFAGLEPLCDFLIQHMSDPDSNDLRHSTRPHPKKDKS